MIILVYIMKITSKAAPKESIIKKVKKYRVMINAQSRDFDTQQEAIQMALDILTTKRIYYLTLSEFTTDEK